MRSAGFSSFFSLISVAGVLSFSAPAMAISSNIRGGYLDDVEEKAAGTGIIGTSDCETSLMDPSQEAAAVEQKVREIVENILATQSETDAAKRIERMITGGELERFRKVNNGLLQIKMSTLEKLGASSGLLESQTRDLDEFVSEATFNNPLTPENQKPTWRRRIARIVPGFIRKKLGKATRSMDSIDKVLDRIDAEIAQGMQSIKTSVEELQLLRANNQTVIDLAEKEVIVLDQAHAALLARKEEFPAEKQAAIQRVLDEIKRRTLKRAEYIQQAYATIETIDGSIHNSEQIVEQVSHETGTLISSFRNNVATGVSQSLQRSALNVSDRLRAATNQAIIQNAKDTRDMAVELRKRAKSTVISDEVRRQQAQFLAEAERERLLTAKERTQQLDARLAKIRKDIEEQARRAQIRSNEGETRLQLDTLINNETAEDHLILPEGTAPEKE